MRSTTVVRAIVVVILAVVVVTLAVAVAFHVRAGSTEPGDWLELAGMLTWMGSFSVVGALVALHRRDNPIGWLCLAFAAIWAVWLAADAILVYEEQHPGSIPDPGLIAALAHPWWVPGIAVIALILLLFPDGHLPSRRWSPVLWTLVGTSAILFLTGFFLPGVIQDREMVNPIGIEALEVFDTGAAGVGLVVVLIASVAACAVSVVFRFRRATGVERLQLKWLMAAAVLSAVGYALIFAIQFEVHLVFGLIPIAIGLSMHRYRLYDIDRLISRTVTYTMVVGTLALIYSAIVFLLGELLPGSDSSMSVAISTLAVATAFNPVRRRLQTAVDRRFNRTRFDAAVVVERFSSGLRDQTDSEHIVSGLLQVVSDTLHPEAAGVWVKGR